MEILINDKTLDFELDKPLSLTQLLDNIQEWALKDNMFILDYKVNGIPVDAEVEKYNSDNIEILQVDVGSKQVLIWENINELQNYLEKIISYIAPRLQESDNVIEIDNAQLEAGMIWVLRSFESLSKYFGQKIENDEDYIEENILLLIRNGNYVSLLNRIKNLKHQITKFKKQIFYNLMDNLEASELKNLYVSELVSILGTLEKIASDLTIGKDMKALNSLEDVIEWLSIGLIVFEKTGTDIHIIEKIKITLDDLEGSLKNSDFVSLADIIDFDLRDALSALL